MNVDEIFCYLLVAMATRHPDGENCINGVFDWQCHEQCV